MTVEVLSKEDLEKFRIHLIKDIKDILIGQDKQPLEWLKSSEVRKILKISHGTLQSLRISGKLKFTKIGGTYYYQLNDINHLLEGSANGSK